jgi:GH25 family lysozyme M1 (1,4-beta-N-acetylmuramidase)
MIYTNGDGYNRFIKNNFETLPIWFAGNNLDRVESIIPLFWQFDQHGKIDGATGEIDLNVFSGNLDDWRDFRNSVNQSFQ